MVCRNCNNQEARRVKTVWASEGPQDKCENCGVKSYSGCFMPDVWYGYGSGEHSEMNIAYPSGHPKAGQPIPFSSKQGKREAMKIAKVREGGDRWHGMRK